MATTSRSQKRSIASALSPCWVSQAAKLVSSLRGSPRSRAFSRPAVNAACRRSRSGRYPKRSTLGTRCTGAGSRFRRSRYTRPPGARTGTSRCGWRRTRSSTPRRARSARYAAQQRRKTCCPLSTSSPPSRVEKVAPPSRGRASRSVTRAPASAHVIAARIPASPPPTTTTWGGVTTDRRARTRGTRSQRYAQRHPFAAGGAVPR